MVLHIKYDINLACKIILQEHLDKLKVPYRIMGLGEIEIDGTISSETYNELKTEIKRYGIVIIDDPKNILVQRTKYAITEMVYLDGKLPTAKTSAYLAQKLDHNYTHLSKIFMEVTYSTIPTFVILQKIERAKQMMIDGKQSLTEIAYALNYSSIAHLSNQFKNTTGLTPSAFQRILKRRKAAEATT